MTRERDFRPQGTRAAEPPRRPPPSEHLLLALQRSAGNHSVSRYLLQRVRVIKGEYARMGTPDTHEAVRVADVVEDPNNPLYQAYDGAYDVRGEVTGKKERKQGLDLERNARYGKDEFVEIGLSKQFVRVVNVDTKHTRPDYADEIYLVRHKNGATEKMANPQLGQNLGPVSSPGHRGEFEQQATGGKELLYLPDDMFTTLDKPTVIFRGDNRPPSEIFKIGFHPREQHFAPMFRTAKKGIKAQFDIAPQTGVSVSPSPQAAALFPINDDGDTYIYAVVVQRFLDTGKLQRWAEENFPKHAAEIHGLLFAKELTLGPEGAPQTMVVGAAKVSRRWITPDHAVFAVIQAFEANPGSALTVHPKYGEAISSLTGLLSAIPEWKRETTSDFEADTAGVAELKQRLEAERDLMLERWEAGEAYERLVANRGTAFAKASRARLKMDAQHIIDDAADEVRDGADQTTLKALYARTLRALEREIHGDR